MSVIAFVGLRLHRLSALAEAAVCTRWAGSQFTHDADWTTSA